jgi:proline racemase
MDLKLHGYVCVCVCVMYPSQEKDHSQVLLVVENEETFLISEAGSMGLSRSTVHHGVSLNVHQDCSRLPVDRTLETQLLHLRGLELMMPCSPLKS